MNIAILGAGVTGLTAARLLNDRGHSTVVFEKEDTIGGLARSRYKDGFLYDPHGGHILNSKHPEVMEWVFSLLPKDNWKYTVRNAKIYFNGKYVSYPFELSLCELDMNDAVNCIHDFILAQNGEEPANFKDWLVWNFGQAICDYYMIPYNEKIWSFPLENMETQFMRDKMPLPTKKEMIKSMLLKDPSERKMPHSTFYYPYNGGIQSMVDAIANGLNVKTGSPVESITRIDGKWIVNGVGPFDIVISTIPLPVLPGIMELPEKIIGHIKGLKYNSLTTVLFQCRKTDITWLYIPSHDYKSHRVGYQSALTPNACPSPDMGCGALEIIGERFDLGSCNKNKILPEELGFTEPVDSEFTEYAYVIHDTHYRENTKAIFDYFDQVQGFELVGRWGTWNYKNMDLCMYDAMELVRRIG